MPGRGRSRVVMLWFYRPLVLPIVPVGGGGLFLTAFFTAFFAAFLTACLVGFFVATCDSPLCRQHTYAGYQDMLNRLQYQLSSRMRRISISLRRSAMSLPASNASASPKPG